jgi:adenylate cyclase
LRPYALADAWRENRRDVLEILLLAARAGLLDFRWDILCPSCRGPKAAGPRLRDVRAQVHCDTCRIDFKAGFDRTVEVSFRPNASIRPSETAEYCVGGPQVTPHIRFRQALSPGASGWFDLKLEEGWYRLRSPAIPGFLPVLATPDGLAEARVEPVPEGWPREAMRWRPNLRVSLANPGGKEMAYILERTSWQDDAVTAAEVTALQTFRDLFAEEALRPGEEISVGSLTFLFTDLKGSTRLYREVGDAKAFALVMEHFDLLKSAIADEGGAIVKTIGDAVMAVFPHPQSALRAALQAHRSVDASLRPLVLKAGVHTGPCIAVNQNDRLDYFGSTLNLSARLLGFCSGGDVVMTREVAEDPETARWLSEHASDRTLEDLQVSIRGFEKETFALKRILPEQRDVEYSRA